MAMIPIPGIAGVLWDQDRGVAINIGNGDEVNFTQADYDRVTGASSAPQNGFDGIPMYKGPVTQGLRGERGGENATWGVVNGKEVAVFRGPNTSDPVLGDRPAYYTEQDLIKKYGDLKKAAAVSGGLDDNGNPAPVFNVGTWSARPSDDPFTGKAAPGELATIGSMAAGAFAPALMGATGTLGATAGTAAFEAGAAGGALGAGTAAGAGALSDVAGTMDTFGSAASPTGASTGTVFDAAGSGTLGSGGTLDAGGAMDMTGSASVPSNPGAGTVFDAPAGGAVPTSGATPSPSEIGLEGGALETGTGAAPAAGGTGTTVGAGTAATGAATAAGALDSDGGAMDMTGSAAVPSDPSQGTIFDGANIPGMPSMDDLTKLAKQWGVPLAVVAGLFEKNNSPLLGPMTAAAQGALGEAGKFAALPTIGLNDTQQQAIDLAKDSTGLWKADFDKSRELADKAAGGITEADIAKYTNPYLRGVLDPVLRDIKEAAAAKEQKNKAIASMSGNDLRTPVVGGNRYNIEDELLNRELLRATGDASGKAYSDAYTSATGLAGKDLDRDTSSSALYGNLGKTSGALAANDFNLLNEAGTLENSPLYDERQKTKDAAGLYTNVVHGTQGALGPTTPSSILSQSVGALGALKSAKDLGLY